MAKKTTTAKPKTAKPKRIGIYDALRMLKAELTIPRGRCWLVMGAHAWGKAFDIRQAWENSECPESFMLFDAPPCAWVDGMGAIVWYPTLYATDAGIRYEASCVRVFKDGVLIDPKTETVK